MERLVRTITFLFFLLSAGTALATTYYVDYSSGSDSNAGTSTASPWQRAPGMNGCTGNCLAHKIGPGDQFILKGGVTWPASTLCWVIQTPGTSGNPIYLGGGTTHDWYSGSSWTRPILNGGGTASTGSCVVYGTTIHNIFIAMDANYITVDNIEFTGMYACSSCGESHYIDGSWGPDQGIISNNYFHGWVTPNAGTDPLQMIYRSPGYSVTSFVLDHNIFDGFDTATVQSDPNCTGSCQATGEAYYGFATEVTSNVCRYVSNCFIGDFTIAHDNLFEYLRVSPWTANHMNALENNSDCNARIYNNVFRHWNSTSVVGLWVAPSSGCTDYVFNNVVYDTANANMWLMEPNEGCSGGCNGPFGTVYNLNNTVEAGPDATGPSGEMTPANPAYSGTSLATNNHQISSTLSFINCPASNCSATTNTFQSQATANGQGYVGSSFFAFSPTASTGATVSSGSNYTSYCSIDADLVHLCSDTTYGVAYDSTNHSITGQGRSPSSRPASGAWDRGAYQYVTGPNPPTSLTAAVM